MRFFSSTKFAPRSSARRRPHSVRPQLEKLEDRALPSSGLILASAVTSLSSQNDGAFGLAVQDDGKILAAGESNGPGYEGFHQSGNTSYFSLVRYNVDLTLDTSFGNSGIQTTAITQGRNNAATAIALQPA